MSKSKMLKYSPINTKKVVIAKYIRVSTDKQREEGFSIDVQKERLDAYVKSMFPSTEFVAEFREYVDDGYSGASLDRPKMAQLIYDIENNEITHVVVIKLDRLSRSQKDTLHLIEDIFLPHNVAFISMGESFNTATPFGRAVVGILSVFAQLERENIFERTRSGMQKRVELGYWPGGGGIPFGYDYDPNKGILVPNKDADTVRKIYELYIDGYSCQAIANRLGLKYDRLAIQILTRKSNTGVIVYNGKEYQGLHEPLISMETYEKAMCLMAERSKKKIAFKGIHLLTGLVYCGKCGSKMRYILWGKNGYKLMCYSQQTTKKYLIKDPNCDNQRPWAKDIEEAVLKSIFDRAKEAVSIDEEDALKPNVVDILNIDKQRLQNKLKRLYNLYAAGSDDELLSVIQNTQEELKDIQHKIDIEIKQSTISKSILEKQSQLSTLADYWDYMNDFEKQNVIRSVINKITIYDNYVHIDFAC